jgi:hypothetical protein
MSKTHKPVRCPYCSTPQLWNVDFTASPATRESGIAARGHFLKRITNPHYPAWPLPLICREAGNQHSKLVLGHEHFAHKWKDVDVEILGLSFDLKPPMPPLPLFGMTAKYSPRRKRETRTYILWNACRITHKGFDFVIKLHWWPDHKSIFCVEKFAFEGAKEMGALTTALSIFSPGRGRKPTEYFTSNKHFLVNLKAAIIDTHSQGRVPLQLEIAEGLFPEAKHSARELRKWLQTSWRNWRWADIVQAVMENAEHEKHEEELLIF